MKNIYILFLLLFVSHIFSSCYDDKGNYEYQKFNDIEITFPEIWFEQIIGDTVKMYPKFTYSTGDSTNLNLKHEWRFGGRLIGTERQLNWIVDTNVQCDLVFRVTNLDNGITYLQTKTIRPSSVYASSSSYMVLSERDGKSLLTFVRYGVKTDENGESIKDDNGNSIREYRIMEDIYQKENNEELNGKPLFIREHIADIFPSEGHVIVFQEGGLGSVDLDGLSMQKDILLQQSFIGGTYPNDFHPVNAEMMDWTHLIENYDGKIYSKVKETLELFQSGYYIHTPLMFENKEVRGNLINTYRPNDKDIILLHERGTTANPENRLLLIHDLQDDYDDINYSGKVVSLPQPKYGWPENFAPLTDFGNRKLVNIAYSRIDGYSVGGAYSMFLKDPDGTYYFQYFEIGREYSDEGLSYITTQDVSGKEAEVLRVSVLSNTLPLEDCLFCSLSSTENQYVFIAHGKELYFLDRTNPQGGIRHYYTCKAGIVAMDGQTFYGDELFIGLEDGSLLILNTLQAKNLQTDKEKFLWESEPEINLGKIVDVSGKIGGSI